MSQRDSNQQLTIPVNAQDHSVGPANAPVTLVEYGDFECDSCLMAYPIVKRLQQQMGGRMRFVFRNFPITDTHPHAEAAAEAAEAAGAQGHFWQMHDTLFEHQTALDDASLRKYAEQIGCDLEAFDRAMAEHKYAARVRDDYEGGYQSGVAGTPTFFINGMRHEGFFRYEDLLKAIENAGGKTAG